jgi:hypothetical protein
MKIPTINQVPPHVRRLVEEQLAKEQPQPVKKKRVKHEVNPAHWQGKEIDFQHQAEHYLELIGYTKLNKKGIMSTDGMGGKLGWQVHVCRAIGNPYLLDLVLLRHDGTWQWIELKTAKGKLSDIQVLLTKRTPEIVCRSLDEVKNLLESNHPAAARNCVS